MSLDLKSSFWKNYNLFCNTASISTLRNTLGSVYEVKEEASNVTIL